MSNKKPKLPKHIAMMVDKGNLVHAIKNLSSDENISMDEAKTRIDDYEAELKAKQNQQQATIVQNQFKTASTSDNMSNTSNNAFDNLNAGLDNHLEKQGIQLPLIPYWWWRVVVIVIVLVLVCWLGWQMFYTNPQN